MSACSADSGAGGTRFLVIARGRRDARRRAPVPRWRFARDRSYDRGVAIICVFFFQAEDGIRDLIVTGVQTCALPISGTNMGCPLTSCRFSISPLVLIMALSTTSPCTRAERARGGYVGSTRRISRPLVDRKSVV